MKTKKEKIQKNANQIEMLRKSLERDNSKLNQEAENIISNAKLKARDILLDAKEEANEVIKELNSKSTNAKTANKLRNDLNESINKLSKENVTINNSKPLTADEISIGQKVFYKKLNLEGTVLSLPNKSNEVKVQLGSINMNIHIKDLQSIANSSTGKLSNTNSSLKSTHSNNSSKNSISGISFSNQKSKNISSEINVIGLNVDQAIPIVDKYLDDCYMANLEQARIVHGKGTGKLREGIHNFLKKHPHVKSFRLGTFGEGEMGVTVVSFK